MATIRRRGPRDGPARVPPRRRPSNDAEVYAHAVERADEALAQILGEAWTDGGRADGGNRVRSVFLFPLTTPDEARQRLDATFSRNGGDEEWLVEGSIWVRIVDPPYWHDWSTEEIDLLKRSLGGHRPVTMIQADVSGRIDGQSEVVRLCQTLLLDGGVATDDYSDRCWSLTEILESVASEEGFFRPRSVDNGVSSDGTFPLTIVYTEYGMCLTTTHFGHWREAQDAFAGYKASLGPWRLSETLEYLAIEYPGESSLTEESVRALAASEGATLWARQPAEEERANVPANVRIVAATDELRLLCASTWAEDSAHAAVEHERLEELRRLLDAGWDVDDPTDDGMTLLHHAIDIEIDGATQTGEPLTADLTTLLVTRGADLGHRWHGQTPFEAATERGHHLAVEAIESAGHAGHPVDGSRRGAAKPWWAFWRRGGHG